MATRHLLMHNSEIRITSNSVNCIIYFYFITAFLIYEGFECSVLHTNANYPEDDKTRAWSPPLPFLGQDLFHKLMGERRIYRERDRVHILSNLIDNGFKMGQKREDAGLATRDTLFQESWQHQWHLPLLLSLGSGLALFVVVLIWLKNQMSTSSTGSEKVERGDDQESTSSSQYEGGQWIYHPVIRPVTTEQCETVPVKQNLTTVSCAILPEVMTAHTLTEEKREPIRIKAKGLLERRGSSASLTIDLLHPSQENLSVTPTRECTAEEYLLSAGNVLSRGQLRNCLKDARSLHKEFWDLPLNHPEKLEIQGSGTKNRYRTIIPNESTRVHLPIDSSDPLAGYINANYIRGYDGEEKAFIATQGPLANTVVDFWAMVWQEHSPVIVMITKLMEKSRAKCELYFPIDPGASESYGDVTVNVTSIIVKDGYIIRHLLLQKGEDRLRVTHFWFDSWPDHKTPANAHSLLSLAKDVESYRFRDSQRGSTSSWPHSPKPLTTKEAKKEFLDPLSPCPEAASPPSLKETSPVLNFGRLEFKDDDLDKEPKGSPKSDQEENLVILDTEELIEAPLLTLQSASEAINLEMSSESDKSSYKIIPVIPNDKLNSPTFYDRSLYMNDDVFQVGSLPQKSPVQSRTQLENMRSRSVEASYGVTKSDDSKSGTSEFFDFDKLTIQQESATIFTDDESKSYEGKHKLSSETSDVFSDGFEKKICRNIICTSSPNWASEASPNLTHSFDKSTSKLSVDSLSWGGIDMMSPNLTCSERSPNRTQSSIESPLTGSSSEGKRWTRSSDSSKQWTRSSQGSSGWAQSSEESPWWFEKDQEPESASHLKSPRDWFDRSPLLNRRSREGSISFLWNELPRGPPSGPVIVHCSAGIGRTGCFIAICVGINQLLGENNVDILGIVCRMRYDRGGMVQTAEQYEFIHRALALFERSLPDQSGE